MPQTDVHITSLELHNRNCHAYLNHLAAIPHCLNIDPTLRANLLKAKEYYNPAFAYADLYTQFFAVFEEKSSLTDKEKVDIITAARKELTARCKTETTAGDELTALDDFILSLYANDNGILERTHQNIQHITKAQNPSRPPLEHQVTQKLRSTIKPVNSGPSPIEENSLWRAAISTFGPHFKPQHTTSLSTIRHYDYKKNLSTLPLEYRFGTQGQRHARQARISPLFEHWLSVHKERYSSAEHPITHIYINNLSRDRTDIIGKKETELTAVLEQLETTHTNIAFITLPADRGLMSQKEHTKTVKKFNYDDVLEEFFAIATERCDNVRIKDFYISQKIRALLFTDGETTLRDLLKASFKRMGIQQTDKISPAERQAVWFHFIKYELTTYILQKLKPMSMNFTCKDAIDRGGVSSAYYNLMTSIALGSPMTRDEFEQALHAAPALVKGRAMNHHLNLIWNAIDAYLRVNDNQKTDWLTEWRDLNCPHVRVDDLLKRRVEEVQSDITAIRARPATLSEQHNRILTQSECILNDIKTQQEQGVSGKRLLLEVVTRTSLLIQGREINANVARYKELHKDLTINYPYLQVIASAMKIIIATIALVLTLGKVGTKWLQDGMASGRAGFFAGTRSDLQQKMNELTQDIEPPTKPNESPK